MKIACAGILIAGIAFLSTGCGSGSPTKAGDPPPVTGVPVTGGDPPKTVPPPEPTPDLVFEAKEYEADYKKDEAKAKEKYANKFVEVSGTVHGVSRSGSVGRMAIGEPGADQSLGECYFADMEPWKLALPGQTVKVRGKIRGILFPALQVHECRVVSATGSGPPTLTAAELGAQYAMGADTVIKRLGGERLIVTGEIESIEKFDGGAVILSLTKKDAKPLVRASFTILANVDKERNQSFKEGQKVRILCTFSKFGDSCIVDNCQLLPAGK